jgi:hypothetical protein
MGKIGDLFVRLGLKSDDYKKGMADAKKETTSFSQGLSKMKAGALAVWGAIGASVISFGKQLTLATNKAGDTWAMFIAKSSAGWRSFMQTISSMDWDGFIGRIKASVSAAEELQGALDAEFEISNSIRLQKAAMAEELSQLEILARNVSKPYEVRAKAAQDYLNKVKPLYEQEMYLANKLLDAQQGKWLAGAPNLKDNARTREELTRFLIDYGKNQNLANALATMVEANSKNWLGSTKLASAQMRGDKQYVANYRAASEYVAQYQKNAGYSNNLFDFANVYERLRGDADTKPLIDALIRAGESKGAFDAETRKMQQALNTAITNFGGSGVEGMTLAEMLEAELDEIQQLLNEEALEIENIKIEVPEIDTSNLDKFDDYLAQFVANWEAEQEKIKALNEMLEQSIISSLEGGTQAFTDMLFGLEGADASAILGALMQPFADTAGQLGGMLLAQGIAVEAFKKSLESLQGAPAIAAGLSLIAISAAMKSGIKALAKGGGGTGSTASYGGSSYGSTAAQNYESTLTVNVVGHISGSDIALSLDRTKKNQKR